MSLFLACSLFLSLFLPLASSGSLLPRSSNVLDVREKAVASLHPLPSATNIPLSELRQRLPELDKSKEYTTVCVIVTGFYVISYPSLRRSVRWERVRTLRAEFSLSTGLSHSHFSADFLCDNKQYRRREKFRPLLRRHFTVPPLLLHRPQRR